MDHKYELNRRYEFTAIEGNVCPVPEYAQVFVWSWLGVSRVHPAKSASAWVWDARITHFMVISYPKTKHKAWVNCNADGYSFSYPSKELADSMARPDRIDCKKLEWEVE